MEKIIVIIPTYNERENIQELINKIMEIDKNLDILFVDGNSKDGTKEILDKLKNKSPDIKVIYEGKKGGLGKAYIKGFKYALKNNYELILQMDADLQHNPQYIPKLLEYANSYDLIVASRNLDIENLLKPIPIRTKLSILANLYINLVTGMRFCDTLSGFKCYRRKALESINLDSIISRGFIFQAEILFRIWEKNYKIYQLPIVFHPRKAGSSKISIDIFIEGLIKVLLFK